MCANCEATERAMEAAQGATNARELRAALTDMINRGMDIPQGLVNMVNSMARFETVLEANPDANVEEKKSLLIDVTMDMDGARLDQEFSRYRATGYELIDIAGTISVVEEDSVKCWMRVGMAVVSKIGSPITAIGVLCALLVELGRQPELVADIRSKNQRYRDA